MSGLFGALTNGVKALTAQSRAIESAGRNLANVNNPNYARQRVVFGDRGTVMTELGAQSLGIEAKSIQQLRDYLLDAQVVRETAIKASFEAEQAAYQKAQAGLGQSIDRAGSTSSTGFSGNGSGIAESIAEFFNAFEALAARPNDPGERQTLFQKAGILSDRMQITDTRMQQLQDDLTDQITSDVSNVNEMLKSIANLNKEIGRFEINAAGSAVDLRDQRQGLLEELARKISIDTAVIPGSNGQIRVFARDASNTEVDLVVGANVQGAGVAFTGTGFTGGATATALALTGGSVQGALKAREVGVTDLRNNLNALARQVVTAVNSVYSATGANFFDPAGITAGSIAVDGALTAGNIKATAGSAAGASEIARGVADLAIFSFSAPPGYINGTFAQHFATTVSNLGQSLSSLNLKVEDQSNIAMLVRNQRDAVSGVSLDEEMSDLLKYQRSFQASSRVINIIDSLLEDVVNLAGR